MLERFSGLSILSDLHELDANSRQRGMNGVQPSGEVHDDGFGIFTSVGCAVRQTEDVQGLRSGIGAWIRFGRFELLHAEKREKAFNHLGSSQKKNSKRDQSS